MEPARKAVVIAFAIMALVYLSWRATHLGSAAPVFSAVIYVAELFGFATALAHFYMVWELSDRKSEPPLSVAVDVLIPTYNEPMEMARRTLRAALSMKGEKTVWLLDDGNRAEFKKMAESMGARYLARSSNEHAKAGNLNAALPHLKGELIAIFDVDHAPDALFLEKTSGYFRDPRVAFVQTPQDFHNLDSFQHRQSQGRMWSEQSLFFRVIQRGKDATNSAFFCGSCAMIRRAALDQIGGFATGSITEDLHTSIKLHQAGWGSVYHAESLAFGVAPASIGPFLKQRLRWGQGAMQVWRQEGFGLGKLSWRQRINYMASMATYFDGWQKGIFYAAPAIVMMTGWMPIEASVGEFLTVFIPYYLLSFWAFEETGRGLGRSALIEQYNMSRFAVFMAATLGLIKKRLAFKVTDKGLKGESEERWLIPQALVVAASGAALPFGVALARSDQLAWEALAANMAWAGINSALALAVIVFARKRARSQREEYRFKVPLPARARAEGMDDRPRAIRDISPAGCSMEVSPSEADRFKAGSSMELSVGLPSGEIRLRATVASLKREARRKSWWGKQSEPGEIQAVGLIFEASEEQTEALELMLFGSDLERRLLELAEVEPTPLARLGLIQSEVGRRSKSGPMRAAWMLREGKPDGVALTDGAGRAMFFEPMGAGQSARLESVAGGSTREVRLIEARRIDLRAGSVVIADIEEAKGSMGKEARA